MLSEFYFEFSVFGEEPQYVRVVEEEDEMKTLPGQPLHESDYRDMESQLQALFHKIIFQPIIDLLAPRNAQVKAAAKELKNSTTLRNAKFDPIVAGINSGRIQYVAETFSGDFNATISKVLRAYGAKWNGQAKTFTILPEQLPSEVVLAAERYEGAAKDLHDALDGRLQAILHSLTGTIQKNPIDAVPTVDKMSRKIVRQYGDALGIGDLSAEAKKKLAAAYTESMTPFIKKFSEEQITELRAMVSANAKDGYRFSSLVERIQNRYRVTASKAEFLARNETAIFVADTREARFGDVGVTHYVWRTAGDSEVRKDHRKLNGRTFAYANPPVVDEASGRRGNPGSGDYNCRCFDEPVIAGILEKA